MKLLKSVFAIAALAALATTAARADVTVRITGSTAYRTAVTTAIENILGGAGNFRAAYRLSDAGSSAEKSAKASIFRGTVANVTGNVTIKCYWSGSVGGVKAVSKQDLMKDNWLDDTMLPVSGIVSVGSGGTGATTIVYDNGTGNGIAPDATMSDTRQSTTKFTSPSLPAQQIGVVPFVWIKNVGAPDGLSNMTALLARSVLSNPGIALAQFTGNSADQVPVLAIGRDQDSGTRVAAFAESGYGTLTDPIQWQINAAANGRPATVELYPAITNLLGQNFAIGTGGYGSGGNVITAMSVAGTDSMGIYDTSAGSLYDDTNDTTPNPALQLYSGAWFVGYVGTSDAVTLAGHHQNADGTFYTDNGVKSQILSYNGIPYSLANVREGLYSFWTYEYLLLKSGTAFATSATATNGGDFGKVAYQLANNIKSTTATIKIASMHALRTQEGGVISHDDIVLP